MRNAVWINWGNLIVDKSCTVFYLDIIISNKLPVYAVKFLIASDIKALRMFYNFCSYAITSNRFAFTLDNCVMLTSKLTKLEPNTWNMITRMNCPIYILLKKVVGTNMSIKRPDIASAMKLDAKPWIRSVIQPTTSLLRHWKRSIKEKAFHKYLRERYWKYSKVWVYLNIVCAQK